MFLPTVNWLSRTKTLSRKFTDQKFSVWHTKPFLLVTWVITRPVKEKIQDLLEYDVIESIQYNNYFAMNF